VRGRLTKTPHRVVWLLGVFPFPRSTFWITISVHFDVPRACNSPSIHHPIHLLCQAVKFLKVHLMQLPQDGVGLPRLWYATGSGLDLREKYGVEPICVFGIVFLVLKLLLSPCGLVVLVAVLFELMMRVQVLWELRVWARDLVVVCKLCALLKWRQSEFEDLTECAAQLTRFFRGIQPSGILASRT
jgi:hypothetical protein